MKVISIRWFLLLLLVLVACNAPVAVVPPPSPTLPTTVTTTVGGEPTGTVRQVEAQPTDAVTPTESNEEIVEPIAPVAVPAPPPPQQLTVYTDESGPGLEFLERATQDWSATSGWMVAITPKQADVLRLDFEMAALADQAPNLLITSNDVVAPLVASGSLQPVDDWVNPDDFAPSVVAAAHVDGKQWGVPLSVNNQLLMLYNKKLIGSAPATTDELLRTPKPAVAQATLVTNLNDPRWLMPWLLGFGGRVLDDNRRPALNTPEMVATYTFLRQLRIDGVNPELDFASGSDLFKAGQAAIIIDGDWSVPWYLDAAAAVPDALDLGIAPLPIVSSTNRRAASFVGGRYVLIPQGMSDERREQARALTAYLTGAEVQRRMVTELQRLPARTEIIQSEIVQNDAILKPQADSLNEAVAFPTSSELTSIWNVLGSRTGAVMVGEVPPQTAAEEIQTEAEAMLGR